LIHNHEDFVGVATDDISKGEEVLCTYMDTRGEIKLKSRDDIPFGHKIALKTISANEKIVEYGATIGVAATNIERGEHVHIQNLRSLRL
jgi:(2R)-sulfolactate sulfo-lyase subunit alpha